MNAQAEKVLDAADQAVRSGAPRTTEAAAPSRTIAQSARGGVRFGKSADAGNDPDCGSTECRRWDRVGTGQGTQGRKQNGGAVAADGGVVGAHLQQARHIHLRNGE